MEKLALPTRIKNAWNVFKNKDPTDTYYPVTVSYGLRPDRTRLTKGNDQSIITAIFNRIAVDVSEFDIRHVFVNDAGKYQSDVVGSSLNYCFDTEANIDQSSKAFFQDIVLTMFDEGCAAVIPIDTSIDINTSTSYEIKTMRVARVLEWMPDRIKVRAYNDRTGQTEELVVLKRNAAIIDNPFYTVMNEPNSTLKRLNRKLVLLDKIDNEIGSGRFNIIVRLPYTVKGELKQEQARKRREDIENQLANSKYGIAYIDGTEQVQELNRGIDNNLLEQVQNLTTSLYTQLYMTPEILNGTADEVIMSNYYVNVCVPIVNRIVSEMRRKFITKTARTQGQSIMWFKDPLSSVPTSKLGDMADKFTRNEILSSNEIRQGMGIRPSDDPNADALMNKNISQSPQDNKLEDIYSKVTEQAEKSKQ